MADEIRQNTLYVPAGTLITAPVILDVSFPPRNVQAIEIVVPAGVNGAVGFQILNSHVPVIPYDSDDWIISNGEVISWPITNAINSGSWQLAAYNTGTNDHTLYVRWLLEYLTTSPVVGVVSVLSSDDIAGPDQTTDANLDTTNGTDDDSVDLSGIGQ